MLQQSRAPGPSVHRRGERQRQASRETLEALKRHLSPQEIIELLMIIGHWRQTASILETTEVELEDFAGKVDILEAMKPLT
jgi:hypothetical protein